MSGYPDTWRPQGERSLARSRLTSNERHRPGFPQAEKRRLADDGHSMASKYTQVSRFSRQPPKVSFKPRITSDVPSIPVKGCFVPGTILIGEHCEEAFSSGTTVVNDKSIIRVPGETDICKKHRPFIILATYALHYLAIPIFSHNGNGTKYKPSPEEYVTIRDHRAARPAPAQSVHEPFLTQVMSGQELKPASVAHIPYSVSRRYDAGARIIGRLESSSTERMLRLFLTYFSVPAPTTPSGGKTATIDATMSVRKAIASLESEKLGFEFEDLSWKKAATLTDRDLKSMGITETATRMKLLSIFVKVKIASNASPDWEVKISRNNWTVV